MGTGPSKRRCQVGAKGKDEVAMGGRGQGVRKAGNLRRAGGLHPPNRKRWEEGGFLQRDQPSCGTIFWRKKRYLDAAQLVTRLELGRWSGATKIRNNTLASAPAQGCTLRTPSGGIRQHGHEQDVGFGNSARDQSRRTDQPGDEAGRSPVCEWRPEA